LAVPPVLSSVTASTASVNGSSPETTTSVCRTMSLNQYSNQSPTGSSRSSVRSKMTPSATVVCVTCTVSASMLRRLSAPTTAPGVICTAMVLAFVVCAPTLRSNMRFLLITPTCTHQAVSVAAWPVLPFCTDW
jgi:hypothetical protein